MTAANPYRAAADCAEPGFETEAYALTELGENEEEETSPEGAASSVLMRAEDFTLPDRPSDGKSLWEIATAVALTFAGLMTLAALLAWIGEQIR